MSQIKQLRNEIIRFMPPWMNSDKQLLNYMDLSAFIVAQKDDGLYINSVKYGWDTTFSDLKTDLSDSTTGYYDVCAIDLVEEIDSSGNAWIETNTNFIWLDAMCEAIIDIIAYKMQTIREMNPLLATANFGIPLWEKLFSSERQVISGSLETDSQYMVRAVAELFVLSTSLLNIISLFEQLGLQPFTEINTRKDSFQFNSNMWPYSVNLHLDVIDKEKIGLIRQVFTGASAAGIRLFIFCPVREYDCYGLNYTTDDSLLTNSGDILTANSGFALTTNSNIDYYITPSRFVPGAPIPSLYDVETNSGDILTTNSGFTLTTN